MFRFGHMGMMGWGGGGFMMFIWIIIAAALIYYIVTNNNKSRENNNQREHHISHEKNQAEEIARQRYAKGEISKEEYNDILRNLRK